MFFRPITTWFLTHFAAPLTRSQSDFFAETVPPPPVEVPPVPVPPTTTVAAAAVFAAVTPATSGACIAGPAATDPIGPTDGTATLINCRDSSISTTGAGGDAAGSD